LLRKYGKKRGCSKISVFGTSSNVIRNTYNKLGALIKADAVRIAAEMDMV
jgi:hypothetical protein